MVSKLTMILNLLGQAFSIIVEIKTNLHLTINMLPHYTIVTRQLIITCVSLTCDLFTTK